MSENETLLQNNYEANPKYLEYAATNFTKLSLGGLAQCYAKLQALPGFGFVKKNAQPASIYVAGQDNVPGPQPMVTVSADYLSVDDNQNSEGLQSLGIVNETDDAFAFYAIGRIPGKQPGWLSVRNASEPQIVVPPNQSASSVTGSVQGIAGSIFGIYEYCTTINSAFACWGVVAGM